MGLDYALVHAKYTIPPSALLTWFYWPLLTRVDLYKIALLVTIAVVSTIPWDSYLIRNSIWSYPPDAVLGPTLWSIPIEELFFFVIQTYGVALLQLCLTKPILLPAHLPHEQLDRHSRHYVVRHSWAFVLMGQFLFAFGIFQAWVHWQAGDHAMYMSLIVIWAFPFLFFLWSLAGPFMLLLPKAATIYPIVIPTCYLWAVDTLALRRGTWVIEKGTKLGIDFGIGLDIEEAVFFFLTNCLVVFGLTLFDYATTLLAVYPELAPGVKLPSPLRAAETVLLPSSCYDHRRIQGLCEASNRLQKKSRSFYLASSTFDGPLRNDLVHLYSFCRAADDLVDDAPSTDQARSRVQSMRTFLDKAYSTNFMHTDNYVYDTFPPYVRLAFINLQTPLLSSQSLKDLMRGFEMDLKFGGSTPQWPIKSQKDLLDYGYCVAGTIAELCLDLVFVHYGHGLSHAQQAELKRAGQDMGKALQLINIARDIATDAKMGRVYIPLEWLKEAGLSPKDVLRNPTTAEVHELRSRLLRIAFELYDGARPAIDKLPRGARAPMRVATESYVEIGRVLMDSDYQVQQGRATVGTWRRLSVAWRALRS